MYPKYFKVTLTNFVGFQTLRTMTRPFQNHSLTMSSLFIISAYAHYLKNGINSWKRKALKGYMAQSLLIKCHKGQSKVLQTHKSAIRPNTRTERQEMMQISGCLISIFISHYNIFRVAKIRRKSNFIMSHADTELIHISRKYKFWWQMV